jgi:hypothetical protein
MIKMIMVTALLLWCTTTQASEWMSLGKWGGGNVEILVDVTSIKVENDIRRAWAKLIYGRMALT